MRLDAFLRIVEPKGLDDFCERYPHPVLLFGGPRSTGDPNFETSAGKTGSGATSEETAVDLPPTKPLVRAQLHPFGPGHEAREIHLLSKSNRNPFKNMITLGRSANNDVQVELGTLSKVHAAFVNEGGRWTILDPGSTNGTKVDGVRLEKGKPVPLHDNTRLDLGGEVTAFFYTPRGLYQLLALELAGNR
jgi:hypothetical protein